MLDFATALWLGVIGACVGSFLNVVAYRLPRGMSVVWKPSHCPNCGHNIRARDNVPVLGWLILRGRCRDCGAPFSPRYAIVEALLGVTFFALAYIELFSGASNIFGGPLTEAVGSLHTIWIPNGEIIALYAFHAALLALLLALVLIDQDNQRIPWRMILAAVVLIGGPYARFIPRAALAGLLFITAARLIDWKRLAYAIRASLLGSDLSRIIPRLRVRATLRVVHQSHSGQSLAAGQRRALGDHLADAV